MIYMKDNLKMTYLMEKVNIFIQMEIYMKENLKMAKKMEKVNLFIQMELYMKENGKMANKMEKTSLKYKTVRFNFKKSYLMDLSENFNYIISFIILIISIFFL